MKTNFKVSTIILLLAWMAITQSCLKKKQSLWEMSPCEFTSDDEFATLRESRSFKILDAATLFNAVDTTNAPIHPDSVRLFDANLNEYNLSIKEPKFGINEWRFSRFFPYADVPYNDAQALLDLDEKVYYLSTAYNDFDTLIIKFEKCRIKEAFFNNKSTLKPKNDKTEGGVSFYFLKDL